MLDFRSPKRLSDIYLERKQWLHGYVTSFMSKYQKYLAGSVLTNSAFGSKE